MINIQHFYKKLADRTPISEDETVALLKELDHFRGATAYLASCQAATLDGLPKATSKSARGRHENLCLTAAKLLDGIKSGTSYTPDIEAAKNRCLRALGTQDKAYG